MTTKEQTHNKIMAIALDLFSDQGYNDTTTKQIAEAAGVNEVTLFRHFGTKEKLFQETTETCVQKIKLKKDIFKHKDEAFKDSMHEIAEECLHCCFTNLKLYKLQLKLSEAENELIVLNLSRELKIIFEEYFTYLKETDKVTGDPVLMASTLVSSILGAFTMFVITNDNFSEMDIKDMVAEYVKQFINYYDI